MQYWAFTEIWRHDDCTLGISLIGRQDIAILWRSNMARLCVPRFRFVDVESLILGDMLAWDAVEGRSYWASYFKNS